MNYELKNEIVYENSNHRLSLICHNIGKMKLNCKVEVNGRKGTIVRLNVLGLSSSNGVVVLFEDGTRRMFINKQMSCIRDCE